MRFSAAIQALPIARQATFERLPGEVRALAAPVPSEEFSTATTLEEPGELDQRVRQSGEW
jgi:hypothetical protein